MAAVPGAMTTRYPASPTARQTPYAAAAPGTIMPASAIRPAVQSAYQQNRANYQQQIAQLRQLPRGAERAAAALQAKQLARENYRDIRGFGQTGLQNNIPSGFESSLSPFATGATGTPFNAQQNAQATQSRFPGLYGALGQVPQDVRSQSRTLQPQPGMAAIQRQAMAPQGVPSAQGPSPVQAPPAGAPRPAQYPGSPRPNLFGERQTEGIPNRGFEYQDYPGSVQQLSNIQNAQRSLLGPLGEVFGLENGNNFTLARGDIPLLEAGLNFENILLAEGDRRMGYGELARTQAGIGSDPQTQRLRQILGSQAEGNASPEMQQALQLASQRAGREGQFARQATATRDQYTNDTNNALRDLQASYASRGVLGNESMLDEAMLRQSGGVALNRALADLEARQDEAQRQDIGQLADLAGQNQGFQQASIEQLLGQLGQEEGQRTALGQALANVFLETEREPFDFSGLTTPLKDKISRLPVAGPTNLRLGKARKNATPTQASRA